jgi:peptidoglycan/xylan/chitin deacetylase (PgdA/CDA1 family)
MKFLTISAVLGGIALAGCGGADDTKLAPGINPAVLQRQDPAWQHAWYEVARMPLISSTPLPVLKRGDPHEKVIALTFDDGPHGPSTIRLLKILKDEKVRATFFVVGKMVKKHPDILKAIDEAGEEIGNHSFSHVTLTHVSEEEARADLEACSETVESLTGKRPKLCRPPGGDSGPSVVKAASSLGMTCVMWTTDPGDYALPGSDVILERTLYEAKKGGIILLHDGITQMLDVLPQIIQTLRQEGYKIVTAGELAEMTEQEEEKAREAAIVNPSLKHLAANRWMSQGQK